MAGPDAIQSDGKGSGLRLNRKLVIFLICFLVSTLLWLLTVFGKVYTTTVSFPTRFLNFPSGKTLVTRLPDAIQVEVTGSGFALTAALFNARNDTLLINGQSLRMLYRASQGEAYFLVLNNQLDLIAAQLGDKIRANRISPDTLKFLFDDKAKKIVPVKLNLSYSFARQYQQTGDMRYYPTKMVVKGPQQLLDQIEVVESEPWLLPPLTKSEKLLIPLRLSKKNENVDYPSRYVVVEIPVEKFTEKELLLPVRIKNLPEGYSVKTFPANVKVRFNVALSQYEKISAEQFEAVVDLSEAESEASSRLPVRLQMHPTEVSQVRLVNNRVEYILQREK